MNDSVRARPTQRLSLWEKAVYGFGDVLIAIRMSSFQFYLLPFYTDVVLLAVARRHREDDRHGVGRDQ